MIGWAKFPDKLDYLIQWALPSCAANPAQRGRVYDARRETCDGCMLKLRPIEEYSIPVRCPSEAMDLRRQDDH